ncbi:MAG: hypothetical protein JO006_03450 [Paucibacter sp.]|nr:hypothetical protein [Roseateles sp.]
MANVQNFQPGGMNPVAAQDPNYVLQQLEAQRRAKLADALMGQSMAPIDYDPRGRVSWTQGLAKMLQAYEGAKLGDQSIQDQANAMATGNRAMAAQFGFSPPGTGGAQGVPSAPTVPAGAAPGAHTSPTSTALGPDVGHESLHANDAPLQAQQPSPTDPAGPNAQPAAPVSNGSGLAGGKGQQMPPPSGSQASAPQGFPPQAYASPQGGPLQMPGMSPQQAYMAYMADPNAYMTQFIQRSDNRTDFSKSLTSMGIDPNSQVGRQIMGAWISKQTYIAPENARPGSWTLNPDGSRRFNPAVPQGAEPVFDMNGNMIGVRPMAGAAGVAQTQAEAEAGGRSRGTLFPSIDKQTGRETMVPGGQFFGPAAGPQGAPAQVGQGGLSPGRFAGYTAPGWQPPTTKLGPGESDLGTAGAARMTDLQRQASESPTRVNVLDNILALSRSGVATGPNQDWKNKMQGAFADTAIGARLAGLVGMDPRTDVARYSEITKFMQQNANRNWQAAGGTGTDAQLDAQIAANVNKGMFPQAVQDVALWNKGSELALQAKAKAQQQWAQQPGNSPMNQAQFEQGWRQGFDPRVYQLSAIGQFDPGRLAQFTQNMSAADRAALLNKYQLAKQQGWIQ